VKVAKYFEECGAELLHIVDLDGAKSGNTDNFETIKAILAQTKLSVEIGGGIRNIETVRKYIEAGADRVILGTSAVTDAEFLKRAVAEYKKNIAVGVDIKDGMVAIKGWTELSTMSCFDFCRYLEDLGVETVICTDISKDGMMSGTNTELYRSLSEEFSMKLIASGGVSDMENIKALKAMKLFGAIVGKAIYTGAVDLKEAIAVAEEE
jgi:phosphoribosylformimino-5-aminoimidazole carboxamide ribotide isomerase